MSGCTAVTLLVTKDKLFCGNAGDSRCVLSRKGVAVPLSRDHKPQNKGLILKAHDVYKSNKNPRNVPK